MTNEYNQKKNLIKRNRVEDEEYKLLRRRKCKKTVKLEENEKNICK